MKLEFKHFDQFVNRHIGPSEIEIKTMLNTVNVDSLDDLIKETIPADILKMQDFEIGSALSENELINSLRTKAVKNKVFQSNIGLGYYNCIVPNAIKRNVFENPGWYTQYTPYQAEISQGRLEALLNFQTMVCDLTGFEIANASLLDEGTAAAEAMSMLSAHYNKKNRKANSPVFLVDSQCFPQTIEILKGRAKGIGLEIRIADTENFEATDDVFGILLQYPSKEGKVSHFSDLIKTFKSAGKMVTMACDLLSLALLKSPFSLGADVAVGNTQRFGVPLGYGGPHAAFFACKDEFKRNIPGRIIGVSVDKNGNKALRMALQTREQHIRREKATSNICTAQALLAIMASMYAVYHGANGIKSIATQVHSLASLFSNSLPKVGLKTKHDTYFDTISFDVNSTQIKAIKNTAESNQINLNYSSDSISIAFDETNTIETVLTLVNIIAETLNQSSISMEDLTALSQNIDSSLTPELLRTDKYLQHEVFNKYRSETALMRYIKSLENKDLSLTHSMIPLGSCTMKLNAATELMPVSWSEFANIHPFAPLNQVQGYTEIIEELEKDLAIITGFDACSLQPNSGAQGELAGLMCIKAYHIDNNHSQRNIVLIPSSAHGTNPASAVMAGMKVVVVECDDYGNIKVEDLIEKAILYKDTLAGFMVTYPSTHGVFEEKIKLICDTIHENGGLVYMDGANMNAQVGFTSPGVIGADVCHLNLHKTFSIPHGGGGPGMGPICVNNKLKPFLPDHPIIKTSGDKGIFAIAAAPYGSASILLISYAYIKMLGTNGLKKSTQLAILNANYIKERLANYYKTLYVGKINGRVAHELILDLRPFKAFGIEAEDVAKRLIDYSFHAPTLSFPVAGTIMIEPTESENLEEIDRFCDAMIAIKAEINVIAKGEADEKNNVLKNAPHTLAEITADTWDFPYSRKEAAFPLDYLNINKFWASIGRVNNSLGDRNLICTCPPMESYT